jgi:putative membrane-bound dehydrogenase-like protein
MQRLMITLLAAMLFAAPLAYAQQIQAADAKKKIVIIGGRDSHGATAHNWGEGTDLLVNALNKESGLNVEAVGYKGGYPKDPSIFKGAATVVILCDGGGRHLLMKHLKEFKKYMDAGTGLVNVHYAVEVPKGEAGRAFLDWVGGYFETHWSVNPHWKAEFLKMPKHPITNGAKPFELNDEWYYHMRFRTQMKGVTPILSAHPPKDTLKRGDGAHSGNPAVREAVLKRKEAQHVAWAYDRSANGGKGRGFGITGAHYHKAWDNDSFRTVVLNAIVWTAGIEVPKGGVKSLPNPTTRLKGKKVAGSVSSKSIKLASGKGNTKGSAFASKIITPSTPGHAVKVEADIKGKNDLYLIASDAGDGFSCDWAAWSQPRLVDANGKEKKLTELKWKSASSGWQGVHVNKNVGGKPLRINGKPVTYGLGTHANSVVHYVLPKNHNYVKFIATGGLDNGGTDQGNCGSQASVQFVVYTDSKALSTYAVAARAKAAKPGPVGREASEAVANLDVHKDLQAELFSSEPTITNPSNIDIDSRGRVWVCEIVNYRRHKNKRPEGDRIVILEDTDGDGISDKTKVFYQGKDIDSPHGIAVLEEPDGSKRVIISSGANIINFYDTDGDDKPDKKDMLFTGISGTQHDHGIHAMVFGPDGKLYFNFGNSGRQIKDKDGKPITDKAGNVIEAKRKPYQEGMVFRCNLDGSGMETLGWNFRNNWMATVDSYGSIWQSDNDDDGNKGVRINYVMEFGNYGYKDELTGAAWRSKRIGMASDVPSRHWHLNDPGVMPNLILTGAGSPTGITVYEGTLLPKIFQGQVLHTDAGPSVCRAYPATVDGAGYKATVENILVGTKDRWFRPSDVSVAPDGSIIVADWYDPGVGGHNARDLDKGRLFRVTPKGHKGYTNPTPDFKSAKGAVEALKSPNYATRYTAWRALEKIGDKAELALVGLWKDSNPRMRARALWALAKLTTDGKLYVQEAIKDKDPNIRITALRVARQIEQVEAATVIVDLAADQSPAVRRECLVTLSEIKSDAVPALWTTFADQHDGKDRWYLEALGIAARGRWDACFATWLENTGGKWNNPAGRDIIWRARTKAALPLLVKILKDKNTPEKEKARYTRAFDFHPKGPEKDAALLELLQ